MANEMKVENGDGIGGMTAAAEHLTLEGGDTQTLSFDYQNIIQHFMEATLHAHSRVNTSTKPSVLLLFELFPQQN